MKKHLLVYSIAAACTIIYSNSVVAAQYTAGFSIDTLASYNDNIRLEQNNETAVKKLNMSPKLSLEANTETNKLEFDSTFDFNRFDKSEFNSNDQNLSLSYSHQFENSSVGIDNVYVHDTTLTSETLTSGRIGTKADRSEMYAISPNWSYSINESNLVQLRGTYTTQNYEDEAYTDYENSAAEISWIYLLSERIKFVTAASYSDFRPDERPFFPGLPPGILDYSTRTKTKDLQLGADYQFSENTMISGRVGRSRQETTYSFDDPYNNCIIYCRDVPRDINYGSTAQLNWKWDTERQQFNLNARKATQPTSNGYAVDAVQVGANWSFLLSELDKITTGVSLVRNRAIDKKNDLQNTSLANRDYESVTLQYQRTLTENWFLTAGYGYSKQEYIDRDYRATSNVYSLGISYRPAKWVWSR